MSYAETYYTITILIHASTVRITAYRSNEIMF